MVDPSDVVMNTTRNENKNTDMVPQVLRSLKNSASFSELEQGFANFETFDNYINGTCTRLGSVYRASRERAAGARGYNGVDTFT